MHRLAFALVLLISAPALARTEKTLAYPRDEAWPAAVRFLRVDLELKIVEKDAEAGYVLFELREDKKTFRGSLEVIDVVKDGQHRVRFVMSIEDRPTYVELDMLGKLEHKLRVELGAPAEPPPKPPKDEPKPPRDEPKPDKDKDAPKKEPSPIDDGPPISPTP